MVWLSYLLMFLLVIIGVLLIFVILLQRGRGGGLAGAFGGLGGSSALGTRAGDVFTKITVGMAIAWVLLAATSGIVLRASSDALAERQLPQTIEESEDEDAPPAPLDERRGEKEQPGLGTKKPEADTPVKEAGEQPEPPAQPNAQEKQAETEQPQEPAAADDAKPNAVEEQPADELPQPPAEQPE